MKQEKLKRCFDCKYYKKYVARYVIDSHETIYKMRCSYYDLPEHHPIDFKIFEITLNTKGDECPVYKKKWWKIFT